MVILLQLVLCFSIAYGWGFLSTLIISVASQLGVLTILFSYNNQMAKYLMSLLIAVGISTLVSDAILHLIPEVIFYCFNNVHRFPINAYKFDVLAQ